MATTSWGRCGYTRLLPRWLSIPRLPECRGVGRRSEPARVAAGICTGLGNQTAVMMSDSVSGLNTGRYRP